ncbi:SAF domain-containing protein [Blastococcus aurantiacus]|uniref:SAF domain-containing protein n=1 Tax=Blastococcus aurantiacus TaxID=1550231 RepID=A0A1G7R0D3_9ACTN|nr:SAF domain-containing protein [Blastococcus aurantiacus]SDG04205.1 SAF domain-containing protein [Blastococcus aurantiacus]
MGRLRTTSTEQAGKGNGWVPPPLPKAPVLPPPRRRRRPALLALAVAMVVLGALGAAYLATSLGQTSPVIAIAREVPWGQTITAADLVEARIPVDAALEPIPLAQRDQVIGLVAATTLTRGSLLTRDALTDQRFPAPGQQLVGVGVSPVQLPTTALRPGDDVLLVPLVAGSAPTAGVTGASQVVEATVVETGSPGTDGLRVVDVLVDSADGPDVAARAAAGLIAVVVVAGE